MDRQAEIGRRYGIVVRERGENSERALELAVTGAENKAPILRNGQIASGLEGSLSNRGDAPAERGRQGGRRSGGVSRDRRAPHCDKSVRGFWLEAIGRPLVNLETREND